MFKTVLLVAFSLATVSVFGQQPFQGKIVYDVKKGALTDREGQLTFYFSQGKAAGFAELKVSEEEEGNESTMLIDLVKKMSFEIQHKRKKIRQQSLIGNGDLTDMQMLAGLKKQDTGKITIAGIPVSLWISKMGAEGIDTADLLSTQTIIKLWYADNLDYPIDSLPANRFPLAMFSNGKVFMGMEISTGFQGQQMGTLIMASSVTPGPVPDSLFHIPDGYDVRDLDEERAAIMSDTAAYALDTAVAMPVDSAKAVPAPVHKVSPAKKKAPVKKKTTAAKPKTAAHLRKNN